MRDDDFPTRSVTSTVILTFGVLLGLYLCYLFTVPFLPAIVGSVTLAVLFAPLDAKIGLAIRSRGVSAATTVAIVACIVVFPTILVVGTLLNEAGQSAELVKSLLDAKGWQHAIERRPWLAPALRLFTERFDVPELIRASTSWLAGWSGTFVQGSFSGMISLLLTFYFLFYLLRDRETIIAGLRQALPLSASEFSRIADGVVNTIIATVLGMAVVSALQGVLGGAMFWWLGLPAALFWGVLMGLLAVVPFLGAFVIWAPTAAFLALQGDFASAALLAVWGTVVVGLVDNVVYPILVGNRLMLHTIPLFIAVAGGLILLGAPGVVLGPIVVSVSLALMEIWQQRLTSSEPDTEWRIK
jgi:predicted PurR-regulated permease PerM